MQSKKRHEVIEGLIRIVNGFYLKPIFAFLASIWFPIIIKFGGGKFKLVQNDKLSMIAWVITIIIYLTTFLIGILSINESNIINILQTDNKQLKSSIILYERLIKSIDEICDKKYGNMLNELNSSDLHKINKLILQKMVDPKGQLLEISKEIRECFNIIAPCGNNELVVSMAYNFPEISDEWLWVDYRNIHGGYAANELANNPNSTFYHIYKGNDNFIYYNSKCDAVLENCYIKDKKDGSKKDGSIVCTEIATYRHDNKVARIILSISSYGFLFDNSKTNHNDMGEKIERILLNRFNKRIRIELLNLYIMKCDEIKKPSKAVSHLHPEINLDCLALADIAATIVDVDRQ